MCGYDVVHESVQAKEQIGFVPDVYALYENLTGRQYINYIADLYGVSKAEREERIPHLLERMEMREHYDDQMKTYSHETQTAIKEDNYWYPYGDHPYSYYAKFGSSMPELNYSYQATRDAVIDMAKYWCSLGVNGFRMDAVKHLFLNDEVTTDTNDTIINDISTDPKTGKTLNYSSNLTKNINFWREVNSRVKTSYPNAFFVGENFDGHAYHVAPFYEGFDSLFDFYSYFNITSSAAHERRTRCLSGLSHY